MNGMYTIKFLDQSRLAQQYTAAVKNAQTMR